MSVPYKHSLKYSSFYLVFNISRFIFAPMLNAIIKILLIILLLLLIAGVVFFYICKIESAMYLLELLENIN